MEEASASSRKERKELKRQEKVDMQARELAARRMKKTGVWLAALLGTAAIIGTAVLLVRGASEPLGEDFSRAVPLEGNQHVAPGARVPYASNPPTSGPHWPVPLADGVYDAEKSDEAVIHSLEHGRVWISYRPGISEEAVEQLEGLAGGAVILTPRSANETDIALAVWGRLDAFDLENGRVPEQRVKEFIKRYIHKGPEYIPIGQGGGNRYEE